MGAKKIQGVDTPSQRRYVHQLDALLKAQQAYLPGARPPDTAIDGHTADPGLAESSCCSPGPAAAAAAPHALPQTEADGAAPEPSISADSAGLVLKPACPTLLLARLELSASWYAKPPKDALVCAVHLDRKVVAWSAAVDAAAIAAAHDAHQPIVFQLNGVQVSGDVRVSVFTLDELLEERDKRTKKGVSPRLPFDNASHGPWQGAAAAPVPAEPQGAATPAQDAAKRVIAGKETGCKFFALFHTGFVNRSGQLPVPLRMMDKAFKNKKNKYNADGVATLHFAFDEEAAGGASSGAPAPAQAETAQAETAHEEMADEGELETLHERV